MINALKGLGHNQFEWARYSPKVYTKYKFIKVEKVTDDDKRWSTVIQNLGLSAESVLLRTAYVYDYKPRQHIMYHNKWWQIKSVSDITEDIAPQALALVSGGNRQFILEIGEVDGYDVD